MFGTRYNTQRYSASGYQKQLKKAFGDSASSLNRYIHSVLEESDRSDQLKLVLLNNQREIGQLIGHFSGGKEKLGEEFISFMNTSTQAINAVRWKKNIKKFRLKWYEKCDEFVRLLNTLGEWDIREFIYKQISLIESIITSCIKNDNDAVMFFHKELVSINERSSDIISEEIIKNNKRLFGR